MTPAQTHVYCFHVLHRMQEFHNALRSVNGVIGPHFRVTRETSGRHHKEYATVVEEYLVGCDWLARHKLAWFGAVYVGYPWNASGWNFPSDILERDARWGCFINMVNNRYSGHDEINRIRDANIERVTQLIDSGITPAKVVMFRMEA